MAEVFISDLPLIQTVEDNTTFAGDNGTQSNSVKASQLKEYILGDVDFLGGVKTVNNVTPDESGNIALVITNPNILDNAYFASPVNQRKGTSYVGATNTIDRWFTNSEACLLTIVDGAVNMSNNTDSVSTAVQSLSQKVDNFERLVGKTLTFSTLAKGQDFKLVIRSGSVVIAEQGNYVSADNYSIFTLTFDVPNGITNDFTCVIQGKNKGWFEVVAAKLEVGNSQTLARQENGVWVLNEVPNYTEELFKCQRYFINLNPAGTNFTCYGTGVATSETQAAIMIDLPAPMRTVPTIISSGKLRFFQPNGAVSAPLTSMSVFQNRTAGGSKVSLTGTAEGGLVIGGFTMLSNNSDKHAYVWLSAEL